MSANPKISIITCCYNAEATIEKTLQSVADQSYSNYEHIIIDGGSIDGTLEIVSKFSHIAKVISEKDNGIYDAFNKGLKEAIGEVIGYLNADDRYFDDHSLKHIANGFNEEVDCVFGNLVYVNEKGKKVRFWKSKPYKPNQFQKGWVPAHPTFYCRKWCFDKFGGFDETYWISADFDLIMRFLEVGKIKSKFIEKKLIKMLIGGNSNGSLKVYLESHRQILSIFRKNKIKVNSFLFTFYKIGRVFQFIRN
jgi:glycosyltransferase involved in cell wall biosynthesis